MPLAARRAAPVVAWLVTLVGTLGAQRPVLASRSWTPGEGLPAGIVSGFAQDRDGYVWIALRTALVRFDGSAFRAVAVAGAREGRRDVIRQLTVDRRGAVRVLRHETGLQRVTDDGALADGGDAIPRPPEQVVLAGGDTLWLVGGGELWRRIDGRWHEFAALRDTVGLVTALVGDGAGGVWVGGRRGVLHMTRDGAWRAWSGRTPALRLPVFALAADGAGGAWLATARGLQHVTPDDGPRNVAGGDATLRDTVQHVVRDAAGALYVASRDGIRIVDVTHDATGARAMVRATWPIGFTGARVTAQFVDRDGALWIGTEGAGVHQLRTLPLHRLRRVDGLPAREVHQVLDDGAGGLWIAGGCRGVTHRDVVAGLVTLDPPRLGLRDRCVHALARDGAGRLAIGQAGGITLDATGAAPRWVDVRAVGAGDVGPLHVARDGRLWFGTLDGALGRIAADGAVERVRLAGRWVPGRAWSIVEDVRGLHVGQFGALTTIRGDSVVRRIGVDDGVPRATIRGILLDGDGGTWLATYGGGLAHVAPDGRVRVLGRAQGLFDDALSAVVRDAHDRLWLLGDRGIAAAPRADLLRAMGTRQAPASLAVLGVADSVAEGNGGFPNVLLDAGGTLHVATTDGVASVDTRAWPFAQRTPPARIDAVRLDDAPVARRGAIVVPPGNHALEADFSAPALVPGGAFRYRLAGHDRDWVEAGTARTARWTDVSPGRYVLEVVATRAPGAEGGAVASLGVTVEAAWWERGWLRAIALLALIGVVVEVARRAVARANARTERLRTEIAERERAQREADLAAREAKHAGRLATAGVLATSVAHEINQPLTAVMANAAAARTLVERGELRELVPALDDILAQAARAADVVTAMRRFVRKESDGARVADARAAVRDTLRITAPELVRRGVSAVVDAAAVPPVAIDPVQLQQVLVNLVLNAADAVAPLAPERRTVRVEVARDGAGRVRLAVHDRGPGFGAAQRAHLFEPFFTTKAEGLGLGLPLSRAIAEAHGGTLVIEPGADGGATVALLLPAAPVASVDGAASHGVASGGGEGR